MTVKECVWQFLSDATEPKGPTEIGLALGYGYNSASSAVTPALKSLVAEGKVARLVVQGKVKYAKGES